MSNWRPEGWYSMVESPYMHDGVQMARENPERALELELQHQAFRGGQEAGADAMLKAICEEIEKVENPYFLKDIDGGYYNKYPEFEIFEDARKKILALLMK
ncbi:hypothetical protein MUP77_21015 [Candidatus Bathyarchaeota archaeon]|nr:hypothetical protein [Candidatus Bathyarchaeota archaeon]